MNQTALNKFIPYFKGSPYRYRLKLKGIALANNWSKWLIQPSESYLETEKNGPIAISVIEWIEIDPIEINQEGKLVAPRMIDHTATAINFLTSESIYFIKVENRLQVLL